MLIIRRLRLFLFTVTIIFWHPAFALAQATGNPAPVEAAPLSQPGEGTLSSLDQLLIHIYQQQPQLNADRDNLKVLDERVSQAMSGFRPNLSATAGTGKQRESLNGADWDYGDATNGSLVLTQPVYNATTYAQLHAAKARMRAGRAHLLSTEQAAFLAAITAWLDMYEKDKLLELNQENLQRLKQFYDATQQRLNAGDGTHTDMAQAESRLADAEARLALAEAEQESAHAAFQRDTGLMPQTVTLPAVPQDLPASREEAIDLARNNPELVEATETQDAAEHDIDVASSSLWPNIFIRGSMSEERSPVVGLDRLRDDSITINLSMPLYQGGGEYSRVREAKVARQKSREDAILVSRSSVERASQSWSNFHAASLVITASQKASEASHRLLDGIQEEQKQGTRTLTEVLDAESQWLGTQVTETQAQKNLRLSAYRLLAATGRLTAEGLHLATPLYNPQLHYDDTASRWIGF
jgi:TolC family type I secretion outer membrane protein